MPLSITDHSLAGVERLPYPEGPYMGIRRLAIIHSTDGGPAKSSWRYWCTPEARGSEAHVIIDRDGTIYQVRRFDQRADHAGESSWTCPRTGRTFTYLNSCAIGIELANGGSDLKLIKRWSKLPPVEARHRLGGPVLLWEAFPPAQVAACLAVTQAICKRYNLDDVRGHDDVAPRRKLDPGPAFPLADLRRACGF